MTAIWGQSTILVMWVGFAVLALAGIIAVFVWAVRSRQFSDPERARWLALRSGIPQTDEKAKESVPASAKAKEESGKHVSD